MPGRNYTNTNSYRYGFNGKENDNEVVGTGSGTQDYGMRIYNPALGKFLSVDPLTKKFAMLTPYQFASNTPIQAIDLDGLEAFFVSGTWANGSKKWGWSTQSKHEIAAKFNNTAINSMEWSGNNNTVARKMGAIEIAKQIYEIRQASSSQEPITLVGHSHGGNVMIEVANILAKEYNIVIDNLVTVNTPVREYQLSSEIVGKVNHINIYNNFDGTQVMGGNAQIILDNDDESNIKAAKEGKMTALKAYADIGESGYPLPTGELGPAGRTFKNATNISYEDQMDNQSYIDDSNHNGNSDENVKEWSSKIPQHK